MYAALTLSRSLCASREQPKLLDDVECLLRELPGAIRLAGTGKLVKPAENDCSGSALSFSSSTMY
jgi:hypothetical protein